MVSSIDGIARWRADTSGRIEISHMLMKDSHRYAVLSEPVAQGHRKPGRWHSWPLLSVELVSLWLIVACVIAFGKAFGSSP